MVEATRNSVGPRRRRGRTNLFVAVGVVALLAGAIGYAARDVLTGTVEQPAAVAKPQAAGESPDDENGKVHEEVAVESDLIDDDGKTLWASPTHGPPLDLAYLPPGVEIVLALRPAELLTRSDGDKIVAALGPLGKHAIESVERAVGIKLAQIEQLLVGWSIARDGAYSATLVVTTKAPLNAPEGGYQPKEARRRVTVIAPPAAIAEIRQLNGHEPPLARDLERLVPRTDSLRDVTVVLRPHALMNDANDVFQGSWSPLRRPLAWFFGEDVSTASLSLNWDENFFMELVAVPTLDSSPEKMSDELAGRVAALPDRVEDFVLGIDASPYGRHVVARLPEMVRRLAAYTRHGFDQDAAVLRCYLPAAAGHNLLMGAELALAEGQKKGHIGPTASRSADAAASQLSIEERLQKKTSLRFAREELEAALGMLGQDVGVEFVIRGSDLQLDGITRNQLLAIDMSDRPAEEILVEILRRANPDKLATGPADPRQKLVYIVGPEAVFITTRARVAEQGELLPGVFSPTP